MNKDDVTKLPDDDTFREIIENIDFDALRVESQLVQPDTSSDDVREEILRVKARKQFIKLGNLVETWKKPGSQPPNAKKILRENAKDLIKTLEALTKIDDSDLGNVPHTVAIPIRTWAMLYAITQDLKEHTNQEVIDNAYNELCIVGSSVNQRLKCLNACISKDNDWFKESDFNNEYMLNAKPNFFENQIHSILSTEYGSFPPIWCKIEALGLLIYGGDNRTIALKILFGEGKQVVDKSGKKPKWIFDKEFDSQILGLNKWKDEWQVIVRGFLQASTKDDKYTFFSYKVICDIADGKVEGMGSEFKSAFGALKSQIDNSYVKVQIFDLSDKEMWDLVWNEGNHQTSQTLGQQVHYRLQDMFGGTKVMNELIEKWIYVYYLDENTKNHSRLTELGITEQVRTRHLACIKDDLKSKVGKKRLKGFQQLVVNELWSLFFSTIDPESLENIEFTHDIKALACKLIVKSVGATNSTEWCDARTRFIAECKNANIKEETTNQLLQSASSFSIMLTEIANAMKVKSNRFSLLGEFDKTYISIRTEIKSAIGNSPLTDFDPNIGIITIWKESYLRFVVLRKIAIALHNKKIKNTDVVPAIQSILGGYGSKLINGLRNNKFKEVLVGSKKIFSSDDEYKRAMKTAGGSQFEMFFKYETEFASKLNGIQTCSYIADKIVLELLENYITDNTDEKITGFGQDQVVTFSKYAISSNENLVLEEPTKLGSREVSIPRASTRSDVQLSEIGYETNHEISQKILKVADGGKRFIGEGSLNQDEKPHPHSLICASYYQLKLAENLPNIGFEVFKKFNTKLMALVKLQDHPDFDFDIAEENARDAIATRVYERGLFLETKSAIDPSKMLIVKPKDESLSGQKKVVELIDKMFTVESDDEALEIAKQLKELIY